MNNNGKKRIIRKSEDLWRGPKRKLPADLEPRRIERFQGIPTRGQPKVYGQPTPSSEQLERILENSNILVSIETIERGLSGRGVNITTTPTRIIDGQFLRGYILQNPATSSGLTASGTFLASSSPGAGTTDTTGTPQGVANYRTMSMYLDITTAPSALTIDLLSEDPESGNWANAQVDVFVGVVATGTYYVSLGTIGVGSWK